ncbi:alginate O-acetyltransferase AlgX-related protein [Paenibacillus sp. Leaf72]|uniref:alginate O-acetyltransferase AlgX-related protein n=1 Tax=Paenibacillus sp. Leaf72 TaxID=1736234 RepID=UPI0006FCE3E2|nr:hypothetical protein [Paenibacillus sp. Leaf72]KQO15374.1 hypothetical protein ASF12_28290 [Paenibacillus sp. Leaf72]
MKAYKVFNILMAVFFVLAISLPLVAVNKSSGKISTAENRVLASFPAFTNGDGGINTQFIKEFEEWFNDNLGFRDKFVTANTVIQYNLFGMLTKKDTMIGSDNWLYYVTPEIIKDYQHLNLPSEQQLSQWGNSLEQINNYLNMEGIPFISMLNLDKKTIYPENYPKTILKVGDFSRSDLVEEYLTNKTNVDFFTPRDALLHAKNKATVYSPSYDNGHWNSYGAFIGYLELMKKVQTYLPDIKVLSWNDFKITTYEREVKIYNAVSFSEKDYSFSLKRDSSAFQTHDIIDKLNLSNSYMSVSYQNTNDNLPKILVLGDSYLYEFMTPYLAESFSELTFVYTDNMDRIKSLVEILKPDIVIYENVERSFEKTMNILSTSTEFMDYSTYKNLTIVEDRPLMWIDYFNNELVQQQGSISINNINNAVNISGWALDPKANDVASNLFLKVGDKYYSGSYGAPRTSVSEHFKNPNLTNSGFNFTVNASELKKEGKFSFVIISKDQKYQYSPVEYQIVTK